MSSYPIIFNSNTMWCDQTNNLGYPRPQGNLPMLNGLVPQKKKKLITAYYSVLNNKYH